ncbi:superoxide dismutase family protein [Paenibacillus crassostreae]|uniref:Superoxide dismutase [Cu-Zn] n=1 Tax=Paenibacillus crassostreae TaxID=1763538 RepID=A0A167FF30_9BACL|nr:superoxide dismutase family protein [Paenibacillus crassostreae]AOZ94472.1 superoxide dismutase [Paenibacillus crassostreae]OAB76490.1 superoxide dismutase [Paenibacillus crassostreae]
MKRNSMFVSIGVLCFVMLVAAFAIPAAFAKSDELEVKTKMINSKGEEIGSAVLTENQEGVQIHVEAKNLPPGEHGIHFHETGKCEAPDFKSAGAHLNPEQKQHGFNNPDGYHAGDLPNILVKNDGTVIADLTSKAVTLKKGVANSLLKEGGTALIIHEKADDYMTDPSGNSGNRIACVVIK